MTGCGISNSSQLHAPRIIANQSSIRRNLLDSRYRSNYLVLGASGDLAFKKVYPALFGLYKNQWLSGKFHIVGYARSVLNLDDFKKRISSKIKIATQQDKEFLSQFLDRCFYVSGQYNNAESYKLLNIKLEELEKSPSESPVHRVFYMALPPSVFADASAGLKEHVYLPSGTNRIVIEKPFGKDLDSSRELSTVISKDWEEESIYRIDHYLGKEMVKNLMVLSSIWNKEHISSVQITFKEKIGTEGRGGYFDEFGIIRDVMQNHLLQILSIVAMEQPKTLSAEDVRDEKVKVLKSIEPITLNNVVLGQYTKSADGKEPGYLDDATVPENSLAPTFAAAALEISNDRWKGVPFILKCGKALSEQKAEIRIQFKDVANRIYPNAARNELVVRVQPKEAMYLKFMNKTPGYSSTPVISELDVSYHTRYSDTKIPDAYESLILDILLGDKSNFVRGDELDEAWKIFTPLLHQLEKEKVKPLPYQFGSRGPSTLPPFIEKLGYRRQEDYLWSPAKM